MDEYTKDLKKIAEEYSERNAAGEYFVHIRKRNSSNRDLRALSSLTKGEKFHKTNLKGEVGESMITNSSRLASLIEDSKRRSGEDVVQEMEGVVKGESWEKDKGILSKTCWKRIE